MPSPSPGLVFFALLLPSAALAASGYRQSLTQAANALEDALKVAKRTEGTCRGAITSKLGDAIAEIDESREGAPEARLNRIRLFVAALADSASLSGCPDSVAERALRAMSFLEAARIAQSGEDDAEARRQTRAREDAEGLAPTPPPGTARAEFANPKVTFIAGSSLDPEPSVRLSLPEVTLIGMRGQTMYFAASVRAVNGEGSDWVSTRRYSIPRDPYLWSNAYNHDLRYSFLRERDTSEGRFIARIAAFDASGAQLGFVDLLFQLPLSAAAARDCGTGHDEGCAMSRGGGQPMDREAFRTFLSNLGATRGDLPRKELVADQLGKKYLTAMQLGLVLDLFNSDLVKMDVARLTLPRLVNPGGAAELAGKFRSGLVREEFTRALAAEH